MRLNLGIFLAFLIGSLQFSPRLMAQDPIYPDWSWSDKVIITVVGNLAEYTNWALSPVTSRFSSWRAGDDARFLLSRVYQDYSTSRTFVYLRQGEALLNMPSPGNPIGSTPYVATSNQWHEVDPYHLSYAKIGDAKFVKRDPSWVTREIMIYDGAGPVTPLVSEKLRDTFNQIVSISHGYGMVSVGPAILARKVLGLSTDQVNPVVSFEGQVYAINPKTKRSYTVTSQTGSWQSGTWRDTLIGFLVHKNKLFVVSESAAKGLFGSSKRNLFVKDNTQWRLVTRDKSLKVVATQSLMAVKLHNGSIWKVTSLPSAESTDGARFERLDCCWGDGLVDDVYADFLRETLVAEDDGYLFNITATKTTPEQPHQDPVPRERPRTFDFMPGSMARCYYQNGDQSLFIELMGEDLIYHYDPADASEEKIRSRLSMKSMSGRRYHYQDDIYKGVTVDVEIISQDPTTKTLKLKSYGGSALDGAVIDCDIL